MSIKHSVLVISYNQASLIGACLDSILSQSVAPYEVIVQDDCSTDNTWDIILQYARDYPGIIKAERNDPNLGVFPNVNKILDKPTGDLINFVSGDDLLPAGILEAYDRFIEANRLDCSLPFTIYTNALILHPDGSTAEISNYRNRHADPLDLTLRGSFYVWDTGLSIGLVRSMPRIRTDLGYQADWLQHVQRILCCQGRHYFMDTVGYIYRQSVGVTAATAFRKQVDSKLSVMDIFRADYPALITPPVNRYFRFERAYFRNLLRPTLGNGLIFLWHRIRLGRLPHNNPFKNNLKASSPQYIKNIAKKILCRKKAS